MCVKEGRKGTKASASPCGPLDRKEAPLTDDCMAGVLSIPGLWQMPERGSLGRKDVLRGCHPWVSRTMALGSRRGRTSPLQEHGAKAEWD